MEAMFNKFSINPSCEIVQIRKSNRPDSTSYKNQNQIFGMCNFLEYLRKNKILCDIKIQTDDDTIIFGHKVVLVSSSPYFFALLTRFEGSNTDIVQIKEIDSIILQLLVDYVYTGEITVTEQNAQMLLSAANLLQFDYVKVACIDFMQARLIPSNCIGIKAFADVYNCVELLSSCDRYIKNQFLEVVKHDEFLSLSIEEVIKIISSNDLIVKHEEEVFECVLNWVRYKLDDRYESLPKLLEHTRLPLVPKEYILEKVIKEPLLKSSPECNGYIVEALNFHKVMKNKLKMIPKTIRTTPRQSGGKVLVVFWFTGFIANKNSVSNIMWYDPATKLWYHKPVTRLEIVLGPMALIKDNFVYSVGNDGVISSSKRFVKVLDLSSKSPSWVPTVNMLVDRTRLGIGVIDDCIYAVGGCTGKVILNSVEMFDIKIKKWRIVSSMIMRRCALGVGVLNNRLYAVGGDDGFSALNSVECYDPCLNRWSPVAEMFEYRKYFSVAVLHGIMYAIGGHNGLDFVKSVEAFNPSIGVWSLVADMHFCRIQPQVFVLEGLLYVFGGQHAGPHMETMDIYNPNTNTWSLSHLPKKAPLLTRGVVVDKSPYFIV